MRRPTEGHRVVFRDAVTDAERRGVVLFNLSVQFLVYCDDGVERMVLLRDDWKMEEDNGQ